MDKGASIFFILISILLSVILPIFLSIFLIKIYKASLKAVFIGTLIFVIFQPLFRIQILKYIQGTNWYSYNSVINPWIIYVMAGFSAAIFESLGRFVGFKFLLKDNLDFKNGIAYGLGHGGIEAILFAGIPFINALVMLLTSQITSQQPPILFLVGGMERLFAMTFHVAASLMVLYAVKYKNYRYLLYAILVHGIIDSSIGFIKSVVLLEGFIAIAAIASLVFIVYKFKRISSERIFGGYNNEI
jgi:uncharacterized membrane protein YhfC